MKHITKIIPRVQESNRLRAAAYCRVSTNHQAQQLSLASQCIHFESVISDHSNWEFVGVYFDEALSGTSASSRPGLQNMLADCRKHLIDVILVKSVSRFARNTVECLEMVRELTDLGVSILFEKENIDTGKEYGEFVLTLMAAFSESESRSISDNEKWAVTKRFENGTFRISKLPYGFRYEQEKIVINEEETEVVRDVFKQILEGSGLYTIAKELNEKGIPTRQGGKWHPGTLQHMVDNPFYVGDQLLQKTYVDDQFKRKKNKGECKQYYWKDHHPPLISRQTRQAALAAIHQRGKEKGRYKENISYENIPSDPFMTSLPEIFYCKNCGSSLIRKTVYRSDHPYTVWTGGTHQMASNPCCSGNTYDLDIQSAFTTMINKLITYRTVILLPYLKALQTAQKEMSGSTEKAVLLENMRQIHELVLAFGKGKMETPDFYDKLSELYTIRDSLMKKTAAMKNIYLQNARALEAALHSREVTVAFDEAIFTEFIYKASIHQPEEITFYLNCGLYFTERLTT